MTRNRAHQRLRQLLREPVSRLLLEASQGCHCHLVGGALRDALVDRAPRDLDAVVDRDGQQIAERLADLASGRLVLLGGDRFAAFRVVLASAIVDLWDRQGKSLESDLTRRDFTINSLALDLRSGEIVDPAGGLTDLEDRLLRATSAGSFASDPLRVFRLARLAGQLPEFSIDPKTVELARDAASGHSTLAPERVRSELELMLTAPDAVRWAALLARLSLYPDFWAGRGGAADGALRALAKLAELEDELTRLAADRRPPLDTPSARMALLFDRLPAASSDLKPYRLLESFRQRGYLTRRAAQRIAALLQWRRLPDSDSELRWFLHRAGGEWPTAIAYLGARAEDPGESSRWPSTVRALQRLETTAADQIFDPAPLLDGKEIQLLLGLPPGPKVGRAVRELRRRQIEGSIRDRSEAESYLRSRWRRS